MITLRRTPIVLFAAVGALAVAGCGDSATKTADIPASDAPPPTAGTTPQEPTTPQGSTNLKDTSKKPQVPKQSGPPPKKLVVKDIVVGKGQPAKKGDHLTMQYVGVLYDTGEQFDASWDHGQPFDFTLGQGNVIKGWDQGLVGIKPGGRRQLTIPPNLAYGASGQPPTIPPNSTLVFIVDAKKVSGK